MSRGMLQHAPKSQGKQCVTNADLYDDLAKITATTVVIWLQIVKVSPGTHLVKNHDSKS